MAHARSFLPPRAAPPPSRTDDAAARAVAVGESADSRLGHRFESIRVTSDPGDAQVRETADRGTRGPAGALPHLDAIQRAFGGAHDLGGVRAHRDAGAARTAHALGAAAFTVGEHVAFARAPSLRVAAHEAAHVVQQRAEAGAGDAQERHADAVADRVLAGRSAAPLLDGLRPRAAAAPTVQLFKDAKHRESVFQKFDSFRPHLLQSIVWLDLYDGVTLADRLEVVESCTWMNTKQEAFARRYVTTHGLTKEIRALALSGQLSKEDAPTALATVEMFAYLSDNAERFTAAMVPKIDARIKELETQFKSGEMAYDSMSAAVDSELLTWLESLIMSKIKEEVPDAHDKGLVIPIVEFAQNAGFFYDETTGLVPNAPELWAKGIHDMLAAGLAVLEQGASIVDPKQKMKFIKMLAAGGCYPKRTSAAEQGLKPDVAPTLQGTLTEKLGGAQSDEVVERSLHAMQQFFLAEQLGASSDTAKPSEQQLKLVNGRVFKTWVQQKLSLGLTVQKEKLAIDDHTLDRFIREQYPFQHPDDQREMELAAQQEKAQKQAEATLDLGWQLIQNKFVEKLDMGNVARMKLEVGLKVTLKEDPTVTYELAEVDTGKKIYKFKLVKK